MKLITTGYPDFAWISTINDTIQKPRLLKKPFFTILNTTIAITLCMQHTLSEIISFNKTFNFNRLIKSFSTDWTCKWPRVLQNTQGSKASKAQRQAIEMIFN